MGKQNLIKIERKTSENCTSDIFKFYNLGQVDSPESPETPKITKIIENFTKVTKHLTKLKEAWANYVWEKSHFKKQ